MVVTAAGMIIQVERNMGRRKRLIWYLELKARKGGKNPSQRKLAEEAGVDNFFWENN